MQTPINKQTNAGLTEMGSDNGNFNPGRRISLRVPRHRNGKFRTELFGQYQRNEQALILTMMELVCILAIIQNVTVYGDHFII